MKLHDKTFAAVTAISILTVGFSLPAVANDQSSGSTLPKFETETTLKDCSKHEVDPRDCNIHDRDTYLHMKTHVPTPDQTHAWSDYRKWQHWEQKNRN